MNNKPRVSVVIPTRHRPDTVCRAVGSVLKQSFQDFEILVVVDGQDDASVNALAAITDPRLRVIVRDKPGGGSNARNTGVAAARGEWIAFLDDDDEWLPSKLTMQLDQVMSEPDASQPIVSCRLFARTTDGDRVLPSSVFKNDRPVSDYLFVRDGIRRTEGLVTTSTILARRSLLLQVPFTKNLKRHQDWDWILRATELTNTKLLFCREPLVIWHMENDQSVSRRADWQFSWNWIRAMKSRITPRAYASFVTCHVAWQASAQRAWSAFFPLLGDAMRNGSLGAMDVVRYVGFWMVSPNLRHRLAGRTN